MTDEQYQQLTREMKNIQASCNAILIVCGISFGCFITSRFSY